MKIIRALAALWALTDRRRRLVVVALVLAMFVAGAVEMAGMLTLFAYISGLGAEGAAGSSGILRRAFDLLFPEAGELRFAVIGGLFVIGVFAFKNLLAIAVAFFTARFLMKLYERVTPRLLRGFLTAPYEQVLSRGTAEPTRVVTTLLDLFNTCLGSAMQALSDIILIATIAALLVFVDPLLTLLAAAMFGLALVLMHEATRTLLLRMGAEAVDMQRQSNRIVAEGFGGLISHRLAGTTTALIERYSRYIHRAALLNRRRGALAQLPRASNEVLLAAGIVATVVYFGLRGEGLAAAIPTLALFGLAGLRLTAALSRLSGSLQAINERQAEFDAVMATIGGVAPELIRPSAAAARPLPPEPQRGELAGALLADRRTTLPVGPIELREVTFTYPETSRPAVDGVSLAIAPHSFVAVCGPSGSGKSTLLLVTMGLMRPQHGDVLSGGVSVFDHLPQWHARIGYVGQRPFIAARSVRENVAFGRALEEIDDDRVWHALELAQLADVVRALPQQLASMLGEDGSRVSGGQRQRLDIARALYDDPDVLFLDEATAALDTVTEQEVTQAILVLSGNKTIVCIAHRLSTVRAADTIHLMEEGRVTASGTYDELVRYAPSFRRMAEAGQAA